MDLSVIIPVFNGANFVGESIALIHAYLEKQAPLTFEIIVVNDGSTDETAEVLRALDLPNLSVINSPTNGGKFASIRRGMAKASGRCRIFTDADLPYDLEALPYLEYLVNKRGFHIVTGDRTLRHSIYAERLSPLRRFVSQLFTHFVRLLVVSGLEDTQCGLKAVRGDVAENLFPLIQDNGFSGDVELLYLALKYNLDIKRIPVRLRRHGESSVRVFRHGLMMLRRILMLRGAWKRGDYNCSALQQIAEYRYWEPAITRISSDAEWSASTGSKQDSMVAAD